MKSVEKIVLYVVVCVALIASGLALFRTPRVAYVDTAKLMVGFSEANKVDRELKAEDDKWRGHLKVLQDSLQSAIDVMSREFDRAKPARKKALQDNLSTWNQRVTNFGQSNAKRMEKLKAEKIGTVYEKTNVYMAEYGKRHGYGIILGTLTGGNILYADSRKLDITGQIIRGLNERCK